MNPQGFISYWTVEILADSIVLNWKKSMWWFWKFVGVLALAIPLVLIFSVLWILIAYLVWNFIFTTRWSIVIGDIREVNFKKRVANIRFWTPGDIRLSNFRVLSQSDEQEVEGLIKRMYKPMPE